MKLRNYVVGAAVVAAGYLLLNRSCIMPEPTPVISPRYASL